MTRFQVFCLVISAVCYTLSVLIRMIPAPKQIGTRRGGVRGGVISVGETIQTRGVLLG